MLTGESLAGVPGMSDDSPALATTPSPSPQDDGEYEAIHAALMETARGRAFLAEYARRNRRADIAALLAASERIEATMREQHAAEPAAPAPPSGDPTSDVSAEAGQTPPGHVLDQRVPAFSWLDMPTRQATPQAAPAPAAEPASETPIASAASAKNASTDELADLLFEPGMPAAPARGPRTESKPDTPPLDAVAAEPTETHAGAAKSNGPAVAPKPIRQPAMATPRAGDPLAPLKAMSDEEKIALFS
jgi:hypothetical protein